MSLISDGELRRQLQIYGVDVGPINDTTRNLYQKKLRSLNQAAASPSGAGIKRRRAPTYTSKQGGATKRPKVDNSNVQAKKRACLYPDLSEWLPPTSSRTPLQNNLSPAQMIPGVPEHFSPRHHEHSSPNPSGSRVIPGAKQLPTSKPRPPHCENSNDSLGVPEHFPPMSRPPHSPTPLPLHSESSNPGSGVVPSEQLPTSRPLYAPARSQETTGATKHEATHSPSYSPSSCSSRETSSSSLSPIGSMSPPSPPRSRQHPTKKPHGSSPGLGLFGTVTKFIGARVNQFFNIAEPRRSLQPTAGRNNSSRDVQRFPPSPEHITPLEMESPVEDEFDFEDEIAEATSLSTADASSQNPNYDWELHPSEVTLCKRPDGSLFSLGKGGFGEVFKGLRDGADEIAVKIIRISSCTPAVVMQFKAEIDLISKLRHRHIVQFYGACIQPHDLYMVTELMSNDLFSVLRLPREAERYKWSGIYGREVLIGVASGLNYLHSRSPPVVHRDVKSPNILVMDGMAKIADVGVARTMGTTAPDMTAQRGFTIAWAAPEVVYRRRATEKIDIWSLAVIMWEVVSGKLPRPGTLVLPATCPQQLKVLYSRCISDNPMGRPSALEVVNKLRSVSD